jgi:hypothetical protein
MAKLMSLSSLPGPQQGQVKKEKVSSLIPVLARHLAKADQPRQQQSSVSSLKLFSQVSEVRSHCYGLLEEDNEELMTFVYDQCGKMDNLTEAASASNTNKAWAFEEEDLIMALARDSSEDVKRRRRKDSLDLAHQEALEAVAAAGGPSRTKAAFMDILPVVRSMLQSEESRKRKNSETKKQQRRGGSSRSRFIHYFDSVSFSGRCLQTLLDPFSSPLAS